MDISISIPIWLIVLVIVIYALSRRETEGAVDDVSEKNTNEAEKDGDRSGNENQSGEG